MLERWEASARFHVRTRTICTVLQCRFLFRVLGQSLFFDILRSLRLAFGQCIIELPISLGSLDSGEKG